MQPDKEPVDGSPANWLLKVTSSKKKKYNVKTTTGARFRELDLSKYDAVVDLVHCEFRFRTKTGKVIPYKGKIPGLGPRRGLAVLLALLRRPGRFFTPYELRCESKIYRLQFPANVIAAVAKIRTALEESGAAQWFILTTSPLAVAWNADRSFLLVERAGS